MTLDRMEMSIMAIGTEDSCTQGESCHGRQDGRGVNQLGKRNEEGCVSGANIVAQEEEGRGPWCLNSSVGKRRGVGWCSRYQC